MSEPWGTPEGHSGTPIRTLCFLDDDRLAVTVVTQARGRPGLPTRNEPSSESPFRLDAIVLRAASGKILATPDWPSNSRFAGIAAASDKGFVTERGEQLSLVSPSLMPIRQLTLPPLPSNQPTEYWSPHASWSGKRLLFLAGPAWTKARWLWTDSENLTLLNSWEDIITGPVTVSDNWLLMSTGGRHFGDPPPRLEIATPGGDWKSLPSTTNPSAPQFVAPGVLYFHRYGTVDRSTEPGVFLMWTDSDKVSRLEPPRNRWGFGQVAASRTGKRFVILMGETKGSHPALDVSGHSVLRGLVVYDAPFEVPSFVLEVQGSDLKNPDTVAISPDGKHVAVLAYPDPLLEVFELPGG